MSCLKSMHIKGLKKFKDIEVNFNDHVNILVGENEAGKSTILEALKIVLNQQYKTADKAILNELFNRENINLSPISGLNTSDISRHKEYLRNPGS